MTRLVSCLNAALVEAMDRDETVFLLGEDVLDPYGGAFKVTAGLSRKFPNRVLTTPVSEAAIVGMAAGLAIRGLKAVVEIMFGDFVALAADQVINHAAKYHWTFNKRTSVPIVIRTPMGGYRGYGPTHSQSLERMFFGVPGLRVVAMGPVGDPGDLLRFAILNDPDPVLFVEHKLLYGESLSIASNGRLGDFWVRRDAAAYPTYTLSLKEFREPDLTIACYGYVATLAQRAVLRAALEEEIFAEIVIPSRLSPLDITSLVDAVVRSGKLLVVEEAPVANGWGAEVCAAVAEGLGGRGIAVARVGARPTPIPTSKSLEAAVLPSEGDVLTAIRQCTGAIGGGTAT